ncbi:MAG: hypothetical protein WC023_15005 [Rhodocyclaceae bacterium]
MTSFVSRTAGVVGSTATAAAATPGPHQPVAATVAIAATGIGLAADAVESQMTGNSAKLVEGAFYTFMLQKRVDDMVPLAAPITNEVVVAWKASGTRQELGAWAEQRWLEFRAKWNQK